VALCDFAPHRLFRYFYFDEEKLTAAPAKHGQNACKQYYDQHSY
jgi:hypothetical protein